PLEAVPADAAVPVDAPAALAEAGAGETEVDGESRPADPDGFATVGEGELTMAFLRSGINVRVAPDVVILDAARKAGVRIGANCQEGMCGSCKVVRLEGEVEMNHQGGIRAREIDAGKFLPCCSTAKTDLVIDA
ncbi:ferredoxin reductase, partial [Burkholderia multivorans]